MLDERFGGKLPETIFIQIDGGPENATKTLLAVCALIVHKQLGGCKQIILTRLPVGHTHEDIGTVNVKIYLSYGTCIFLSSYFC